MRSKRTTAATFAVAAAAATGVLTATAPAPAMAANSVANIPLNILQTVANLPANQIAGVNKAAFALEYGGNWWLYTPGNALGFDQADIAKVDGLALFLMPIPGVAQAIADPINRIFEANFPMTAICTGAPSPCGDPTYWTAYFKVLPWDLIQGVTYGDVPNTIDPSISMPWSNTTQRINIFGIPQAIWETLTKDPDGFDGLPTVQEVIESYLRLGAASFTSLNPFVEGTYCNLCQLVGVKAAPGSLPRIPLFDNWYTFADFGQPFTEDNWVDRPEGIPPAADVDALSLWSPEGQKRLQADAAAAFERLLRGDFSDNGNLQESLQKILSGFTALVPEPSDLTGTAGAISKDFTDLLDSITTSFGPQLPSAGSALSRLNASQSTDAATDSTAKKAATTAIAAGAETQQATTDPAPSAPQTAPTLAGSSSPAAETPTDASDTGKSQGKYSSTGDGYSLSVDAAPSSTDSAGSGSSATAPATGTDSAETSPSTSGGEGGSAAKPDETANAGSEASESSAGTSADASAGKTKSESSTDASSDPASDRSSSGSASSGSASSKDKSADSGDGQ